MEVKSILTLLGVVCLSGACGASDGPMGDSLRTGTGSGAPEVVVQLKYEQGELNRIYLTQFRKDGAAREGSVPAATELCADLCHAGLGGEGCGAACKDMMPVGLATALRGGNASGSACGAPRVRVCPALCAHGLGVPLCSCPADASMEKTAVDWEAVCSTFCESDGYELAGCPSCKEIRTPIVPARLSGTRLLDTSEGWISWCNTQCRQGHGGAACNCDRAPFQ